MDMMVKRRGRKSRDRVSFRFQTRGDVCRGGGPTLSPAMNEWLNEEVCGCCQYAVVAYVRGCIIGFIRWDTYDEERQVEAGNQLRGTYVEKGWRGAGIGGKLWELALARFKRDRDIEVTTTSRAGTALVKSIQRRYHGWEWETWFHDETLETI